MQPLIGEELRRSDDPSRRAELVPELGFEQYAQLFDDVAALCREKVVLYSVLVWEERLREALKLHSVAAPPARARRPGGGRRGRRGSCRRRCGGSRVGGARFPSG